MVADRADDGSELQVFDDDVSARAGGGAQPDAGVGETEVRAAGDRRRRAGDLTVQAGQAAGMATVVACWGYLGQGDAPAAWGADHLTERPSDLIALISGA